MSENIINKPNVLYIITHDQGIAASCYGKYGPCASEKMNTPNIDEVAKNGVILTQHFGTAPQCSPARGSLITSMHPHVNGLTGLTHRDFEISSENKLNTIFQQFKNNGYFTKLIGFQHETKYTTKNLGYQEFHNLGGGKKCYEFLPDIESSLKKMKEDSKNNKPTWLTIGLTEVHLVWDKWTDSSKWYDPKDVDVPGFLPDTLKIRKHIGQLYSALEMYDSFIGNVMDMVHSMNLDESTIIIITTDHGIAHPRAKGTLYDPGNHNLMIYSYPPQLKSGKKIDSLLSSIDFAPTMCDLCGIPINPNFMGKSYINLLNSDEMEEHTQIQTYIFTELTYHDVYNPMRSVRSERFKYIKNFEADKISLVKSIPGDIANSSSYPEWVEHGTNTKRFAEEFYDLQDDPLEENNLLDVSGILLKGEYKTEFKKLKSALMKFLQDTDDLILKGPYPAPKAITCSNAKDFDHIPTCIHTTKGKFTLLDSVIPSIKTSYGGGEMIFEISIGEILEEFVDKPLKIIIHGSNPLNGKISINDEMQISITPLDGSKTLKKKQAFDIFDILKENNIVDGDSIGIYIVKFSTEAYPQLLIEKLDI